MLGLDSGCDAKLKALHSNLGQVWSCISEWMQSLMQKKGRYNKKAKYLNMVASFQKYTTFAHILPNLSELKDLA
eukprot:134034-Ditylum_brightwellii.AAC.1